MASTLAPEGNGDQIIIALAPAKERSRSRSKTVLPRPGIGEPVYWIVEGSLLDLGPMRPVAFLTWNAQRFSERWVRRLGMAGMALARPFAYAASPTFATRLLYTLLRGVSRDRLDLLGEEYFQYVLKPRLHREATEALVEAVRGGERVVLVGQLLENILRPLAHHLGIALFIANRLDYRDGRATGRLLDPIVSPRGPSSWIASPSADGRISRERLLMQPGWTETPDSLENAVQTTARRVPSTPQSVALFRDAPRVNRLPIRDTLAHRHVLLTGVTGFIGKVWFVHLLDSISNIGKITLLIRRTHTTSALRRFEKVAAESPAFDTLRRRHGPSFDAFLRDKVEVVEGDTSMPGLGLDEDTHARLLKSVDLIVNTAGLTDFNPDLREALSSNVDSARHLLHFLRQSDHAGLVHLSTCYVAGMRDGRITEDVQPHYNPLHNPEFDPERETAFLRDTVRDIETRADSRLRWARKRLARVGTRRAQQLGWPNTYTFTKSLGESILAGGGRDLPIAIVRPSIVASSERSPFTGWNEGINTSGPLTFLMGTNFRQLPSNEHKCLDFIPVDMVCRGMTLIAAAVIARCHARVYQLATSAITPVNVGRIIELTSLAHRKHYRKTNSVDSWLKMKFETIPVSKQRYERLSIPMQRAVVSGIKRVLTSLHLDTASLARAERSLIRAGHVIKLYEPFILHNDHVFECEHARLLSAALGPEERPLFAFAPESIDWWEYWINVHIPALRRWCYPLMRSRLANRRSPQRQHLMGIQSAHEPLA